MGTIGVSSSTIRRGHTRWLCWRELDQDEPEEQERPTTTKREQHQEGNTKMCPVVRNGRVSDRRLSQKWSSRRLVYRCRRESVRHPDDGLCGLSTTITALHDLATDKQDEHGHGHGQFLETEYYHTPLALALTHTHKALI